MLIVLDRPGCLRLSRPSPVCSREHAEYWLTICASQEAGVGTPRLPETCSYQPKELVQMPDKLKCFAGTSPYGVFIQAGRHLPSQPPCRIQPKPPADQPDARFCRTDPDRSNTGFPGAGPAQRPVVPYQQPGAP